MTLPLDPDFQKCLKRGLIKPFAEGPRAMAKELAIALTDLGTAKSSLGRGDAEWATVQAYYAAFHAARALLHFRGYREDSHVCLWIALRALYVPEESLSAELVDRGARIKRLRESANYDGVYSTAGAQEAIDVADKLIRAAVRQTGQQQLL